MKSLWKELTHEETRQLTQALIQRLRQSPETVELINDIMEAWFHSGARVDFNDYVSDMLLESQEQDDSEEGEQAGYRFVH